MFAQPEDKEVAALLRPKVADSKFAAKLRIARGITLIRQALPMAEVTEYLQFEVAGALNALEIQIREEYELERSKPIAIPISIPEPGGPL